MTCAGGGFGPCECDPPDAGHPSDAPTQDAPCVATAFETCDGADEDCDGRADEGFVCPDDTITNVEEYEGGVWFAGTLSDGACWLNALQQFWPSHDDRYMSGFGCTPFWFAFRPSDNALFYVQGYDGIRRDVPLGEDPLVDAPPCGRPWSHFGFDARDHMYYECDTSIGRSLRRDDGEMLAAGVAWLEAVLPSGRTVVAVGSPGEEAFTLRDIDGFDLGGPVFDGWDGRFVALETSSTVQGEAAWMIVRRAFSGGGGEFLVLRVDGDTATWSVARRMRLEGSLGVARLALPDGTIFGMEADPDSLEEYVFREYAPGDGPSVVYREHDATVRVHVPLQFVPGPRL